MKLHIKKNAAATIHITPEDHTLDLVVQDVNREALRKKKKYFSV